MGQGELKLGKPGQTNSLLRPPREHNVKNVPSVIKEQGPGRVTDEVITQTSP